MSSTTTPAASWTQQLLGYRQAQIDVGDTLRTIALRELGDASQWVALANINSLEPPYIVDSLAGVIPGQRVLVAGQTINIPAPAVNQTGVASETDILGTDLLLTDGMLTADASGDIASVSGPANLVQALEHAMETRQRELIYHPTYGDQTPTLIGKGNDPVTMQLAAAWTAACLASDPRVQSVERETAAATGDTIAVSATVIAITGKPLPVGATLGV